jgi:rhamnosyltransferase
VSKRLKIAILGSRGIPAKYGGGETVAQDLSTGMAEKGFEVYVSCESRTLRIKPYGSFSGVRLVYFPVISAIRNLSEVAIYDALSVIWSTLRVDIIYMTGYFSILSLIFPKLLGKVTIVNVDGLECRRRKFNSVARFFLRCFEMLTPKIADYILVDSRAIGDFYRSNYRSQSFYVPNGTRQIEPLSSEVLNRYNLKKFEYYLVIARLIPDNNIKLIIDGFERSKSIKKLVIVGPLDKNKYIKELLKHKSERVVFIGGVYEPRLQRTLRHNCFAYIHGHEMGGVNPSLVEALSCSNVVLALDVPFNREAAECSALYFQKDPNSLKEKIELLESGLETSNLKKEAYLTYKRKYTVEIMVNEFTMFVMRIPDAQNSLDK